MSTRPESATRPAAALSFTELLEHDEFETEQWRQWFRAHPEVLDKKIELAMQHDVRGVLFHIFIVELRYGERLLEQPETANDALPKQSVEQLFAIGAAARKKYREFMARASDEDWRKPISFKTLSVGQMSATKRKCFIHSLLHGMRHWAQLATVLRQQGSKAEWHHDFMFTKAME